MYSPQMKVDWVKLIRAAIMSDRIHDELAELVSRIYNSGVEYGEASVEERLRRELTNEVARRIYDLLFDGKR